MRLLPLLGFLLCAGAAIPACLAEGVATSSFGALPDGEAVTLYAFDNGAGIRAKVIDYGATVLTLELPGRSGLPKDRADVLLGYDTLQACLGPNPYFGTVIGRFADRIAGGLLPLGDRTYTLSRNDPPHTLHGGFAGFDKKMWKGEIVSQSPPSVRFSRLSPDGEEGFPGNLKVSATYTLTREGAFRIAFEATTDKRTVFNPTSHFYFNLAGSGTGSVYGQRLSIRASRYLAMGDGGVHPEDNWIPSGAILPVAGTRMDFRKPVTFGKPVLGTPEDPVYFDHTFVLDAAPEGTPAAELLDPASGRRLRIYTDQPGIHLYPGNSLLGKYVGKEGLAYPRFAGVCLEPLHFSDSPHHPAFPSTVLEPGQTFRSVSTYAFDLVRL